MIEPKPLGQTPKHPNTQTPKHPNTRGTARTHEVALPYEYHYCNRALVAKRVGTVGRVFKYRLELPRHEERRTTSGEAFEDDT
jgi:hypothetical protein